MLITAPCLQLKGHTSLIWVVLKGTIEVTATSRNEASGSDVHHLSDRITAAIYFCNCKLKIGMYFVK